jgi:hypothetical protein
MGCFGRTVGSRFRQAAPRTGDAMQRSTAHVLPFRLTEDAAPPGKPAGYSRRGLAVWHPPMSAFEQGECNLPFIVWTIGQKPFVHPNVAILTAAFQGLRIMRPCPNMR